MFAVAGSPEAETWYLVVTKEWGSTPLCTVRLGITRPMDMEVHKHAHSYAVRMFAEHVSDPGEIFVFLYNPYTGSYVPTTRHASSQTVTVALLQDYPWINAGEEPRQMEEFLCALGVPEAKLNRKFADWALRRTGTREIPLPEYNC